MAIKGRIPTVAEAARIQSSVEWTETHRPRRRAMRQPRRRRHGGGDCTCPTVYEIRLGGTVTGGTLAMDIGIDDGASVTTETITINWDDTAAEVQTAFETHTKIAASGVDITVKGGSLPTGAVYIVFKPTGDLNRNQPLPAVNTNSLTGTNVTISFAYMTNQDWLA